MLRESCMCLTPALPLVHPPLQGSVSINDVIELPALKQTRPVKSMQVRGQESGGGVRR